LEYEGWEIGAGQEKEASANREGHGNNVCHMVGLSLFPELMTSFKYVMCRRIHFF
jgi:hypothetical protein